MSGSYDDIILAALATAKKNGLSAVTADTVGFIAGIDRETASHRLRKLSKYRMVKRGPRRALDYWSVLEV